MSHSLSDESPEATLTAVLLQASHAIRLRIAELIDQNADWTRFMVLISSGEDTPNVRIFNVRFIDLEDYAKHVESTFPDIAKTLRGGLPVGHINVVVLFDGRAAVRTLPVGDEGPVTIYPINNNGVLH